MTRAYFDEAIERIRALRSVGEPLRNVDVRNAYLDGFDEAVVATIHLLESLQGQPSSVPVSDAADQRRLAISDDHARRGLTPGFCAQVFNPLGARGAG